MKANIEQARSLRFSTLAPPRFAKADSLIGDALQEASLAMVDIDTADAAGLQGDDAIQPVLEKLRNADVLFNAGREELGRVIGRK